MTSLLPGAPAESIWMGRKHAYWIELWEPANRLTLSIRRDLRWFPAATTDVIGRGHGPDVEPEPMLVALAADDSLLWVLIHTADTRWRDASVHDDQVRYDSYVEVIDWKRAQVIGSQRFDEVYYPWAEPGVAGQSFITPEGSVLYRVVRFMREAPPSPPTYSFIVGAPPPPDRDAAASLGSGAPRRGDSRFRFEGTTPTTRCQCRHNLSHGTSVRGTPALAGNLRPSVTN